MKDYQLPGSIGWHRCSQDVDASTGVCPCGIVRHGRMVNLVIVCERLLSLLVVDEHLGNLLSCNTRIAMCPRMSYCMACNSTLHGYRGISVGVRPILRNQPVWEASRKVSLLQVGCS